MANKSVVKQNEIFRSVLSELKTTEDGMDANNDQFIAALSLFIAHCGGDYEKASLEGRVKFSEAIAQWLANTIEAL